LEDKKVKILDTNVLLDYPQVVTREEEYWIIPMCVLREIDDLKKNQNSEIG
jgi:predicted ribonuclease YlaK